MSTSTDRLLQGTAATFSPCQAYRYTLRRTWPSLFGGVGALVNFLMLNPSTADAETNDPTVRRCIGFAKHWGAGGLVVTNAFAFRATDPALMLAADDPIGQDNDHFIAEVAKAADIVVVAWGVHGGHRGRQDAVLRLLADCGVKPWALGITKDGFPRHPLYVAADAPLIPFPEAA